MKMTVLMLVIIMSICQNVNAGFFDFDPQSKLNESDYMVRINRPLAADSLIDEVLRYCGKKNDEKCLATSYFYYGKLLMWRSAEVDKFYRLLSRVDKDVTTDNADQKAMEYFEKSLALAKKHGMTAAASAVYIKMGILQFMRFKDRVAACDSFDRSFEYHQKFQKDNPGAKVTLEKGFKSFEEYIAQGKSEMGCQNVR